MVFRRVVVDKLGIDVVTHDPVILLTCEETGQIVPIVVGIFEATSIAFALEGHELPRPMAHDLLKAVITELDAKLLRIEIHSLENDTYYCNLVVENKAGEELEIDCRPSDAIAVALRMNVDIYMSEELLEKAGTGVSSFTASCETSPDGKSSQVVMRSTELQSDTKAGTNEEVARKLAVEDFLDNINFDDIGLDDDGPSKEDK